LQTLQDTIEEKRRLIVERKDRLKTCKFDRDSAKTKYRAIVDGQVYQKLCKSVAALQQASMVAAKERGWNDLMTKVAAVQAEATVRNLDMAGLSGAMMSLNTK